MNRVSRVALAMVLGTSTASPLTAQVVAPPTILDAEPLSPDAVTIDLAALPESARERFDLMRRCQGTALGWFPTDWSSDRAECFWFQDGFATLHNARLLWSGDQGSAAVEVLSDFLWGLRFAYTQVVTSTIGEDDQAGQDAAVAERNFHQLLTGGGNVTFTFSYPIYARSWASGSYVLWNSYARGATNVPIMGESERFGASSDLDDLNANFEGAVEVNGLLPTKRRKFEFVIYLRGATVKGTTRFNSFLGRPDNSWFLYGQAGVGVRVAGLLTFLVSRTKASDNSLPAARTLLTVSLSHR